MSYNSNSWIEISDTLLFLDNHNNFKKNSSGQQKLAIFDLDNTLIQTKSGNIFTREDKDWTWQFDSVPDVLRRLYHNGYSIIIVSKQMGVYKGYFTKTFIMQKINQMLFELKLPVSALVSINDDHCRKPCIGSYFYLLKYILQESSYGIYIDQKKKIFKLDDFISSQHIIHLAVPCTSSTNKPNNKENCNEEIREPELKKVKQDLSFEFFYDARKSINFGLGVNIDTNSFFCGDAGGRGSNTKSNEKDIKTLTKTEFMKKNKKEIDSEEKCEEQIDFSKSDLLFAMNININFCFPEQIFKTNYVNNSLIAKNQSFDKYIAFENLSVNEYTNRENAHFKNDKILIVIVGPPCCGKTI